MYFLFLFLYMLIGGYMRIFISQFVNELEALYYSATTKTKKRDNCKASDLRKGTRKKTRSTPRHPSTPEQSREEQHKITQRARLRT